MKKILCLICAVFLTSCAVALKEKDSTDLSFHLTRTAVGYLPNPKVGNADEVQQLLTTTLKGREFSFISLLTMDKNGLALMALTPMGIRIFTINYDGTAVDVERHIPSLQLSDMNDIVANVMLAYYPPSDWAGFLPQNWQIVDQPYIRKIMDENNQVIIQIDYEKQHKTYVPIMIVNNVLKYTINLKNLND